ncbi:HTH_Tnp_Tc3_2 domain-containing protein [Trichonephila clavipes]|nr:HTH_Tnp_Tc3_2 domain-containing protein [Trichonephila clavipes]
MTQRDWSMDQWATVLFTDEWWFCLTSYSRRTFIWREPGTRYRPFNVREIDHYGSLGSHHFGRPDTLPCF